MLTSEQIRINRDIADKLNISIAEVEQAIDLNFKAIAEKIKIDEPCEIVMPFLGKLFANKIYIKQFNEGKVHEADSTGG